MISVKLTSISQEIDQIQVQLIGKSMNVPGRIWFTGTFEADLADMTDYFYDEIDAGEWILKHVTINGVEATGFHASHALCSFECTVVEKAKMRLPESFIGDGFLDTMSKEFALDHGYC